MGGGRIECLIFKRYVTRERQMEIIRTLILLIIFTLAYLVRALKKEIVLSTGITWVLLK